MLGRRQFVKAVGLGAAWAGLKGLPTAVLAASSPQSTLVFDAMGEIGICQIRPFITHLRDGAFEHYLDHILHAIRRPRRMEVVWDGLRRRGLSEGDIEKVMGANVLRVYKQVVG